MSRILVRREVSVWYEGSREGFNPARAGIDAGQLAAYLFNNPFPENPIYRVEDLMYALLNSEDRPLTLPVAIPNHVMDYIEELLNELERLREGQI